MLAAVLLLALSVPAPAEASSCAPTTQPSVGLGVGLAVGVGLRVGPASAPREIEAYLDPASSASLRAFIELRRLVADYGGELQVAVHWAGSGGVAEPRSDRVRSFVAALADRGHAIAALRVVARDGLERLHVRLLDPPSHEALAQELGVPVSVVQAALTDRCARATVSDTTADLRARYRADPGAVIRLPSFVVGSLVFDDGPALDRLRPELGLWGLRRRADETPPEPGPPPSVPATSDRMLRPKLDGVLLGGPGLPHRLVVMARDEDDPQLVINLAPVLALRDAAPGRIAVHVVARGVSSGADRLRHRLCAARRLGLSQAYVDYLGREALLREAPSKLDERLLAALDEVDDERCLHEIDPVDLDLPDGTWLDGAPRSRAELGTLDVLLGVLDANARPLDLVFVAPPDEL